MSVILQDADIYGKCGLKTKNCYRYLVWLIGSFRCYKHKTDKGVVDRLFERAHGNFGANGDNCPGAEESTQQQEVPTP